MVFRSSRSRNRRKERSNEQDSQISDALSDSSGDGSDSTYRSGSDTACKCVEYVKRGSGGGQMSKGRHLTPDEKRFILRHRYDMPLKEIAAELERSFSTIYTFLNSERY